ncbi:ActS/PrrB/RegB family redox-sensitive histidine kinase [Ponticoccus sp. SC2-23]|uniref:sensor histidine kinase RegB n=1 Tax=Alexandriicola marinus TaxID=2081710 RepID=UPI000FDB295F|nr:ActS/PrrB/RegB family redox-sensitive histidine kinase [Alexandriicola marinus]MBM1220748.1 ActS/PrrB/RegB family redox-sensitive histidine kinase [Ponticoccus sp. SC6-9]MBM1226007.1 ActS/PrrB/RegB family redox-sensitive histidine kinase [Ponticoccus sp. SC6-15]MBM1231304.1 ActS/PrrB/RegB family redox-sensitive histidine kinase [Ponticoccus sp. SC6-38]MBM1235835.1 ActS/PrrB/RegB family redox-sensitive histidine kinase [Ponticoccus sp. SC6-45]MBM1240327.1 ActS/PrrB/RegB family redox-sensitiv
MSPNEIEMLRDTKRNNWVRLRTLVILRWFAIAGQMGAILVAYFHFDIRFDIGLAVMTVGASVIGNLIFTVVYPGNKRLAEHEAMLMIVFDILQLGLLLYITGGLTNPFALLLLAPVSIAASVLRLASMTLLAGLSILVISFLARFNLPLILGSGETLVLPDIFVFGFWIALVIGVVFLAAYARRVTNEMHMMNEALLATQLALSREQKLTDLGGVVAAAAHELGTPLATIKLVSGELLEELGDRPDLVEDVTLIRDQSDRCRDILRSMGRAGKEDLHLRKAPVEAVVREAAEPHVDRGKTVIFEVAPAADSDPRQPEIFRRPEIVHGLRNLIQNAVDFADQSVEVEVLWSANTITIRIEDDGTGYPQSVFGRIGDPFVRSRRQGEDQRRRPGYEGMGLGLFIAKTLLERSGASISFANAAAMDGKDGGAVVMVSWPRDRIESKVSDSLGQNVPIRA